ncbi:MAG TPA: hypothetical protein VNI20_13215, partial [Fimbriimonadaceae bacterium]|nr:hypothetical protein [Fimbriimonadaceae bacterium]
MSGEPTPPLVPVSSEPPPPVKREPRNPIGWIVSGLLLYMSVVTAVTGYVNGGGDSVENYEGLQSRLKYQVSLKAATDSPVFGALAEGSDRALEHLSEQAAKDAPKSDAAARVAVVAAYEAGGKAP